MELDTFILVDDHDFEMRLEIYEGILFDRIIVDYNTIIDILESGTSIGNILSYSFGSNNRVIKASQEIFDILNLATTNIMNYDLTYTKDSNKPKKIVDGKVFSIVKSSDGYVLEKDGEILI